MGKVLKELYSDRLRSARNFYFLHCHYVLNPNMESTVGPMKLALGLI